MIITKNILDLMIFFLTTKHSLAQSANSQQPTANSQQPTANSQQPTANSQQINFNLNNILFSNSAFLQTRAVSDFILWQLFFYVYLGSLSC